MSDADLLAAFVSAKSEDAFQELVRLHVGMVYAVCRRQLRDAHWAEDVTQAVFVLLARKAEDLPGDVVLGGWLYKTAIYACSNARRLKRTRTYHEKLVMPMRTEPEPDPVEQAEMEELLDEGLMELNKAQREVLVLRFFENRSLVEIARMRNQTLYSTQKALDGGLTRLRRFMKDRGAAVTAGILVAALTAQAARAMPAGLVGSVGSAALGGSAAQSTYVTQLVSQLVQHAGRVKLLGTLGFATATMLALLAIWLGARSLPAAGGPGMAGAGVGGAGAPPAAAQDAELAPLWDTLRKADLALRHTDAAAIAEVVAFSNRQQKANWDEMLPVFAQNQALKQAGQARFGKDGLALTAIKTLGERIDEILPQIDPESFQWALGQEQATLYFAYRQGKFPGGAIFFVKENGQWKIDAGLTVNVALEGLDKDAWRTGWFGFRTAPRMAIQQLDDASQRLVHERMDVMKQTLTHVAERIAHEQPYDLEAARRDLFAADATAPGWAFFRLALKYDNAGQIRN